MKQIEIEIKNPFGNKTFVKFLGGIVLVTSVSIATYFFADKYTIDFRSPILFQNPVIINERTVKVEVKEVEKVIETKEATESAKVEAKKEVVVKAKSPSSRLVAHAEKRPDIYGKIKKHFGDDSMLAGELIARESSFDPTIVNKSSGACGLGQALPCSKMPCELTNEDAECQIVWIKQYITSRYGTVEKALAFHDKKGWY